MQMLLRLSSRQLHAFLAGLPWLLWMLGNSGFHRLLLLASLAVAEALFEYLEVAVATTIVGCGGVFAVPVGHQDCHSYVPPSSSKTNPSYQHIIACSRLLKWMAFLNGLQQSVHAIVLIVAGKRKLSKHNARSNGLAVIRCRNVEVDRELQHRKAQCELEC